MSTPESRIVRLRIGLLPTPTDVSGGEALGRPEVEWTLASITPLVSKWPESPRDLVTALRHSTSPSLEPTAVVAGTQPKRGSLTAFPLYCALWAQPLDQYEEAGRVAQTAILVSAARLVGGPKGLQPYESALRAACRSCRRIGNGTFVPEGLNKGLGSASSLGAVLVALDSVKQSARLVLTEEEDRLVSGLHVLVEDALKFRPPRKRRASTGGRPPRRMAGSAEVDDPTPEHQTYEDQTAPEPSAEAVAEGAAGVRESVVRRIATIKVSTQVPATSLSPNQLHFRAKYRSRAISTSAQGLLLASDRLQLVDIAAAEGAIAELLTHRWKPPKAVLLGASAACASLLLGRPLEKLKKLRVVAEITSVPAVIKFPYLVISDESVVVPGPELSKGFVPKPEEAAFYRTVTQRLVLTLPSGLSWSRQLLDFGQRHLGKEPFNGPDHAGWAEQFAQAVNKRAGSRLTATRIGQFLSRQLVAQCGDWADAALLSGSGDANARLFYYTPTHAHLQSRYDDLWEGVNKGLGRPLTGSRKAPPQHSTENQNKVDGAGSEPEPPLFIGSRGCPKDEVVTMMVTDLIEHFRSALRGRRSTARCRVVHNAIVAYTCLMVLWHSGMRAVTEPVELDLYDSLEGTLGASDKDSDTYYSSRAIWLLGSVQRQIREYWRHLDYLKVDFPDVVASRGKNLFLFDSNGKAVDISVSALRSVLPAGYPFRLSAQRHYLRTRLRELGVPAQSIDAMLGHGAHGQEPYATHSGYSVKRMRREVEPALQLLSENAGWVLLHGLAA